MRKQRTRDGEKRVCESMYAALKYVKLGNMNKLVLKRGHEHGEKTGREEKNNFLPVGILAKKPEG